MDEKSKKIQDLKTLLLQAKSRLQTYRIEIEQKDKQISELTARVKKAEKQQQKMKLYESDSLQIVQQYEGRLKKYQQSLEENQKLIQSHQKQTQLLSAANKNYVVSVEKLGQIFEKLTFPQKQSAESIQELYSIQKIKQAKAEIDSFIFLQKGVQILKKTLLRFLSQLQGFIEKRRDLRLSFVKKEMSVKKNIQSLQTQVKQSGQLVLKLEEQAKKKTIEHKKQLDLQRHQYSKKIPKQQLNIEYVKNIFLKIFIGNVESKKMSLKVMNSLLKLTDAQEKSIEKFIK